MEGLGCLVRPVQEITPLENNLFEDVLISEGFCLEFLPLEFLPLEFPPLEFLPLEFLSLDHLPLEFLPLMGASLERILKCMASLGIEVFGDAHFQECPLWRIFPRE